MTDRIVLKYNCYPAAFSSANLHPKEPITDSERAIVLTRIGLYISNSIEIKLIYRLAVHVI